MMNDGAKMETKGSAESDNNGGPSTSSSGTIKATYKTVSTNIEKDPEGESGQQEPAPTSSALFCTKLRQQIHVMRHHPYIPFITLLIMFVLCGSGLSLIFVQGGSDDDIVRKEASVLALDTGEWFSAQLEQALLPLFSLAQFVNELDVFHDLPDLIGPSMGDNSLPYLMPRIQGAPPTHRNVSGVCDEPSLVQRFDEIASRIKMNSRMEGVLVNLQLVPQAVVCLVHPINNTEDFSNGVYLDSSAAIGHDLLQDPERIYIAEATVPSESIVIAGPTTLTQCSECDPTVRSAFIARLPIAMEGKEIIVNDISYPKWGFAVALINWDVLVEQSGIYESFEDLGFSFSLTRTDRILVPNSDHQYTENIVVLAETDSYFDRSRRFGWKEIHKAIDTTNNEWVIHVCYPYERYPAWRNWAIAACVAISSLFSILFYTILMQKHLHSEAMSAKSAAMVENARQAAKAERELNDFIAHEIRNPLSAAMAACSFVSSAVSEREPLRSADSLAAVQEDVGVIDTSLHFVNDLLRDMLDMHRAANKQMKIDLTAADVQQDIMQPVTAMLYRRNDNFKVILECPESLVVITDRLRLKQVVLNLARNSAKFVDQGFVRLRAVVENNTVAIFVEDSGPGIPEEKRGKLFSKFQESLDSLSQGTGVGLSLCQNLVTIMGGEIYLDESYDSGVEKCPGARFVVQLNTPPIALKSLMDDKHAESEPSIDESAQNEKPPPPAIEVPEDLSVLFVDDDLILRKLFTRSVRKCFPNWTINEASNGEMALEMVDENKYDMIFLDQYMTSIAKQLLGTETARALRAKGFEGTISGLSANDLEDTFLESGANYFMLKPFPCQKDKLTHELAQVWASGPMK